MKRKKNENRASGIVEELFRDKRDSIRIVKLGAPKSHIEGPIQYLYPLELHCDMKKFKNKSHKKKKTDHEKQQQLLMRWEQVIS